MFQQKTAEYLEKQLDWKSACACNNEESPALFDLLK